MNRIFKFLVAVLCVCICGCCSVKEDRSRCPVDLAVDFASCRDYGRNIIVTALGDGLLFRHYYYPDCSAVSAVYEVPRGILTICAAALDSDCPDWPDFSVSVGSEFDSLYATSSSIRIMDDRMSHTVRLHKQFANICIDMSEMTPSGRKYDLKVKGDACGVNLVSLEPLKGEFRVMIQQSDPVVNVLVPRQFDASLVLEVYDEGKLGGTYPIGEYLMEAGYDWGADDLADAVVRLRTCEAGITVQIKEWITGLVEDIVL